MNRLVTTFSRLALVAAVAFAFTSCTQEDTTTGPGTSGNGPTSIAANSRSATAVGLTWHRQATDVTADTVIVMLHNGALVKTQLTSSTDTNAVVDGLALGTIYDFYVGSQAGRSNMVTWAPATRTDDVRIYETFDNTAGHYSGLLINGNEISMGDQAVPVSVSASSQYRLFADLVLASVDNTDSLYLQAGSVKGSGLGDVGKNTRFSHFISLPGGMDNLYYTGDLRSLIATSGSDTINAIYLNSVNGTNPLVFSVLTASNHFARIEIIPQGNGSLIGGLIGHRFVDLKVSYQPIQNAPYASRPQPLVSVDRKAWFAH